jgi:hypothetical protein
LFLLGFLWVSVLPGFRVCRSFCDYCIYVLGETQIFKLEHFTDFSSFVSVCLGELPFTLKKMISGIILGRRDCFSGGGATSSIGILYLFY